MTAGCHIDKDQHLIRFVEYVDPFAPRSDKNANFQENAQTYPGRQNTRMQGHSVAVKTARRHENEYGVACCPEETPQVCWNNAKQSAWE